MEDQLPFKRVGVLGAGTMGSGIALALLYAGAGVVLHDPLPGVLDKARDYLARFLEKRNLPERMSAVVLSESLTDLAGCDLVIEAAPEDEALKRSIFNRLDEVCRDGAILATNTSTLSVAALASETTRAGRVAGLHFFNPAPVMPLVEVVRGFETTDETLRLLVDFVERIGKTPVVVRDTPGFIVNRVARPFYGEALRLLGEGVAGPGEIDLALSLGAGFKMGPFELMDLIGIDINAGAMRSMYEQTFGEPRYRPHWLQMQQMASGNLGRKTGRGFYDYTTGSPDILPAPALDPPAGSGQVMFYGGEWTCGLDGILRSAGYEPLAYPDDPGGMRAAFVLQARSKGLASELDKLDDFLPADVPVFVQCLDATLDEHLHRHARAARFVGIDALFLEGGGLATLTAQADLPDELRERAAAFTRSIGRFPLWVDDAPGLVLPRVVGMLINEAAFAVQDGVADAETVDLAMQLGVRYPRGLLAWGRSLGWGRVLAVLEHLQREYGEERYRPCRLIRRWARQEARSSETSEDAVG